MARSKRRRSSRRRASTKKVARRRRSTKSFGGSRRGFLALPASPIDLATAGVGAVASAFLLPMLVSKTPVAQIQSGWGNILVSAVGGSVLGGLVAKYNKSAGLGVAIGSIMGAGLNAIGMVRAQRAVASGVAGYDYLPNYASNPGVPLSGYGSEVGISGYSNVG